MKAGEFDKAFDDGEDIDAFVDWESGTRPNLAPQRVEVEFPSWMVNGLDRQAKRLGVAPQDLIKLWVAEKLS